jgi:hypothetical protein
MKPGGPCMHLMLIKLKAKKIRVMNLPAGTEDLFRWMKKTKLLATDLMICDGDAKPLCMGGCLWRTG